MNPAMMPMAAYAQQAPEPFVWGEGGQRMTPQEAARLRELAQARMAQGADFSPVGHWTQGLARAGSGILGALDAKKADKARDANMEESRAVMEALLSPDGAQDNSSVMAALANPYISDQARSIAEMEYKRRNPAPQEPNAWERMLTGAGMQPGTPEWQQANQAAVRAKNDPPVTVTLPGGGIFVGPQSELANVLQGGGGQASGAGPTASPPAEAVADLKANPGTAAEFDEVFGPGAAQRVLGGPTQPASGGFP